MTDLKSIYYKYTLFMHEYIDLNFLLSFRKTLASIYVLIIIQLFLKVK